MNYSWSDVNLTILVLLPSTSKAVIVLSSIYDGSELATIECSGLLSAHIDSAMAPNGSQLPLLLGRVEVSSHSGELVESALAKGGYAFSFPEPIERTFACVTEVLLEGGEIEVRILATTCTVTPD
jgi:hypothetical protein